MNIISNVNSYIAATIECFGKVNSSMQERASSTAQKISKLAIPIFSSIKTGFDWVVNQINFASSSLRNAFLAYRKTEGGTQSSFSAEEPVAEEPVAEEPAAEESAAEEPTIETVNHKGSLIAKSFKFQNNTYEYRSPKP